MNFKWVLERMKDVAKVKNDGDIAPILGVVYQTLSNYKTGRNDCPIAKLLRFCQKYEVSMDWLLNGTGEQHLTQEEIDFSRRPIPVQRVKDMLQLTDDDEFAAFAEITVRTLEVSYIQETMDLEVLYRLSKNCHIPMDCFLFNRGCHDESASTGALSAISLLSTPGGIGSESSLSEKNRSIEEMLILLRELREENHGLKELNHNLQRTIDLQSAQIRRLESKAQKFDQLIESNTQRL